MNVIWSALAEQRALEAVDYIAQDRPQAAAAWLDELVVRVARLDRFARRHLDIAALAPRVGSG